MQEQSLHSRLEAIGADGFVSADEVLMLRRSIFTDGVVTPVELNALFSLGERAPDGDPEWFQFFAEAIADYYLREEEPQGYLTAEEFASLKDQVTAGGGAHASALERQLLVKLMEDATKTAPEMARFVGEEIKHAIVNKASGPCVDKPDADLLRRYLFAAGGAGHVAVTRAEAEMLFDINDATQMADNAAEWEELFVMGVVNHLMAHLGYSAPSREEAFRQNAWMRDHSVNPGRFFKRMFSGGISAVRDAYQSKSAHRERNEARQAEAAHAERITPEEAGWLAERIGRNGEFHESERALVERMRTLGDRLPNSLKALVERAA